MKTSLMAALFLSGVAVGYSQIANSNRGNLPADTDYQIVSQGANHRVWQRETYERAPDGSIVPHIHKYTELASGLNYKDASGQWQASKEEIESYPGGAIARHGQYQVIFANNLNSYGAIDMQTPDGKRLRSNIMGLMYHDTATDKAVLIAQLQDSEGELISSNQVLYPNAFEGVKADVRYTYRKGGFEQDVILREQPPTPESYGMNPDTTELEVMTEFVNAPEAQVGSKNGQTDEEISWGTTRLGRGKAFDLGVGADKQPHIPVVKKYLNIQGKHILLEKVSGEQIGSALSKLPLQSSMLRKSPVMLAKDMVLPDLPPVRTSEKPIKLAMNVSPSAGYVMDYTTLNYNTNNFTFQGDTTYYISGYVNISGVTTFEGGAVIKYPERAYTALTVNQTLFKTGLYNPVVFTSANDNNVGETLQGSSGAPAPCYWSTYLDLSSAVSSIKCVRMLYADTCLQYDDQNNPLHVLDSQFLNCNSYCIDAYSTNKIILSNVLFDQMPEVVNWENYSNIVEGVNLTANSCYYFSSLGEHGTAKLTNCIFAGSMYGIADSVELKNCVTNVIAASAFQSVGGGSFYLPASSPYRNAGTTNIDPSVLADLATKTTYPPIAYTNTTFSTDVSFSPQVQRDTDTPDLGYHYDPLDYTFGGCTANTNMTFSAGTAVGWFRTTSGWYHAGQAIRMNGDITVSFEGTATSPTYWVRLNTVQEQDRTAGYGHGSIENWAEPPVPTVSGHFLHCSVMAGESFNGYFADDYGSVHSEMTDCEFYSGALSTYGDYMYYTNCLMRRTGMGLANGGAGQVRMLRNCTFLGGHFNVNRNSSGSVYVSVRDCAFDGTSFSTSDYWGSDTNYTDYDYNAYTNTTDPFSIGGAHDVKGVSFSWQTSWLGDFYLPSGSLLINHGSTTADQVGLYHFTTQTNQAIEAKTIVDIGYHYVSESCGGIDTVWVDDAVPTGASLHSDGGDSWSWVSNNPDTYSGVLANQSNIGSVEHQHYFVSASDTLVVNAGDTLIVYVYLDPTNTPSEVMLQWNNGSWEHRAYWGGNNIGLGTDGTVSRHYMGALPATGQWARLEVPASVVGLEGQTLNGMAFTLYGGRATWDYAGKSGGMICYDTDGDEIPDYIEDANGNGVVDGGETNWALAILSQTPDQTVARYDDAIFSVIADGFSPLKYQWSYNGVNITGATNSSLIINNVVESNAGNYQVVVTNLFGSVTSSVAVLTVVPMLITDDLTNQSVALGDTANFSIPISAYGSCDGPFTNEWLHDGTNISVNDGIITTVAGNGSSGYTGNGGLATNANLGYPYYVTVDKYDNIYISESDNNIIRKVSTNGIITLVVGNGDSGYTGDGGLAKEAEIDTPYGLVVDSGGNLFFADFFNKVIRVVDTNGIIKTVAGTGSSGYAGDGGMATNAQLNAPVDVAIDHYGNLYIVDGGNGVVRKVDTNGVITTVAGNGSWGYTGDGGQATNASLAGPFGVAVDDVGDLYIADTYNSVVRKVDTNGIITTVAGDGSFLYSGDSGEATNAALNYPDEVAVDSYGNIYIADSNNYVIRKVDPNGIITTVAGNGGYGYSGDGGFAANANLSYCGDVVVGETGHYLYIADSDNYVIRKVDQKRLFSGSTFALFDTTTNDAGTYQVVISGPCGSVTSSVANIFILPTITTQPYGRFAMEGQDVTLSVAASSMTPLSYQWWLNGTNMLVGATGASLILTDVQPINTGSYSVVVSNSGGGVTSASAVLNVGVPQPSAGLTFQTVIGRPRNGSIIP